MNLKDRRMWVIALGRALSKSMETQGLSALQLAEKANLSKTTVNATLSGNGSPSWLTVFLMAKALGLTMDEVVTRAASHRDDLVSIFKKGQP
jgi:transcriptional regulator with XRE-family HTH domain